MQEFFNLPLPGSNMECCNLRMLPPRGLGLWHIRASCRASRPQGRLGEGLWKVHSDSYKPCKPAAPGATLVYPGYISKPENPLSPDAAGFLGQRPRGPAEGLCLNLKRLEAAKGRWEQSLSRFGMGIFACRQLKVCHLVACLE